MPVSKLLVEGELDATLLHELTKGRPAVVRGGSKNALKPKVEEERGRSPGVTICYVRDRDFDMDPPDDRSRPAVHATRGESVLGWYWCRHEMENYLLEPSVVTRATGCDELAYRSALIDAARGLVPYEAARAAVGLTRRSLPPSYKFETRPEGAGDDIPRLPADRDPAAMSAWAQEHAARFRDRICPQLDPSAIARQVEERSRMLSCLVESADEVLIWFAGKDLMAGLSPWLSAQGLGSAGDLRARLKRWLHEHPDDMPALLPEWGAFLQILRS